MLNLSRLRNKLKHGLQQKSGAGLKPLLLTIALSFMAGSGAKAADLSSYTDPNPATDDVTVPLPCGLSMSFRKVYTSNSAERMADKSFNAGLQQTDNPLSESVNERYLQGPFHDKQGFYFLMGKYEVNALQYQAIMAQEGKCPKPKPPLKRPQVQVSWFEAQDAARRLSLFLAKNKDAFKENGQTAFARLPTDSEYEYALRGGHAVSSAQFAAPLFFTAGALGDYAWYQSPQSANGKLNPVGKLKPNPLGIYDLLGNAQEMTQDNFRATRLGRLHGQSGGFTVRGGSYLTAAQSLNAAYRVEKPFYTSKGSEFKSDDTGFRLVLSVPVITDASALKQLSAEVDKLGYDSDDKQGALLKELDTIINNNEKLDSENADLSDKVKNLSADLNKLRQNMLSLNAERDAQRDRAIVSALRLGGFLCSNVANEQEMVQITLEMAKKVEASIKKAGSNERLLANFKRLAAENLQHQQDARKNLDFYVSYLSDHATDSLNNYTLEQIKAQLGNARLSLGSEPSELPRFIERFLQLLQYRSKHADDPLEKLQQYFVGQCYALHPRSQER